MKDISGNYRCQLCGNETTPEVWGGCECTACGSVSVTSLPTQEELQNFYQGFNEDYNGGHKGGGNLIRYAKCYFSPSKKTCGPCTLIDIGSSKSPFPNVAANARLLHPGGLRIDDRRSAESTERLPKARYHVKLYSSRQDNI